MFDRGEPLLERRAGERRVGAGEQGTRLEEAVVRIGRVADADDPHGIAAADGEQRRDVDETLLARAGDLGIGASGDPVAGADSEPTARSARASATVRAATSCVRILGT